MDFTTIEGCRFETYLRYNPGTGHFGIISTRRGRYTAGRETRAAYARNYRMEKPDQEATRTKKWRSKNLEHLAEYGANWRADNKEWIKEWSARYHEMHKDERLAWNRRYAHDHPRDPRDYVLDPYKCTKLNNWFDGCRRHHVDPSTIIHVPEEMHVNNPHNIQTGHGMDVMNALAFEFLFKG